MSINKFLRQHRPAVLVSVPAVLGLIALLALAQAPGGGSGAIFTTTPDGSIVNENVRYADKREVYLDGGPPGNAPAMAAGLDRGLYVFQITNPSGRFLLSRDPARCRVVVVSEDGVIIGRVPPTSIPGLEATSDNWADPDGGENGNGNGNGNGNAKNNSIDPESMPCHIDDDPTPPDGPGVAGPSGQHDTNVDVDHGDDAGAIVVQMMPYGTTPNPGGVYKAWMTPIEAYTANGDLNEIPKQLSRGNQKPHDCPDFCADPDPGFGPPRRFVKTDNFKVEEVVPPPMLHVRKFHDIDGNGMQDAGEPEIGKNGEPANAQCVEADGTLDPDCDDMGGGWPIWITDPTGVQNHFFTPVWITSEPPGSWFVLEGSFSNWEQSVVFLDDVDLGVVNPVEVIVSGLPDESHDVLFGNFMPIEVHGKKVIDLNADGDISTDTCNLYPDPWGNNTGCQGVTVVLSGTDNMGNAVDEETTTDADGEFWFMGIKPGSYTVSIDEPMGFFCSFPDSESCDYDIDVESGDVEMGLDFGDFSKAEVHGTKFIDLNANGEKDVGEGCPASPDVNNAGCEGVTVKLDGTDGMDNAVNLETTTDANGDYSFTDLKPGSYTVTVVEPEGFECSTPYPCKHEVTLVSDEIANDLDFGDFSRAEVHGKKFIDLDANGQFDTGEGCPTMPSANNVGCEGITIHLFGTDGAGNSFDDHTTTNANGEFWFMDLVPGEYTLCEEIPDDFIQSFPASGADCSSHPPYSGGTLGPIGYDLTLVSDQVAEDKDFGNFAPSDIHVHKFFDLNENGVPDEGEADLEGIEFCLKNVDGEPVGNDDFVPGATVAQACQLTDADGLVWWMDLRPGTYTVEETLPAGFFATTSVSASSVVISAEVKTFEFGNVANCVGLTPGYWVNWRNHYTIGEFQIVLEGTVADSIDDADFFLSSIGCDNDDAVHCMRRFLLANQLTLNLTQHPELPNPSGGSLFLACQIPQVPGKTLGDVIQQALEILANPEGFSRDFILAVKNELDAFANAVFVVNGS